jgi:proline dehydrogenase
MSFSNNSSSKDPYEHPPYSHDYDPALLEKLLFILAKKWIAGYSIDQVLSYAKKANDRGVYCILNYLGEDLTEVESVRKTIKEYISLLNAIKTQKLIASISVKPTQIGLTLGYDFCLKNFQQLLDVASRTKVFVWLDMESYKFVGSTIALYREIIGQNDRVGIVLQSYLKRSYLDLIDLLKYNSNIRIVKGAYKESEDIAYQSKLQVDENYLKLVRILFSQDNEIKFENRVIAIATHDSKLIEKTICLFYESRLNKENLQFQFLKGIRDNLKMELLGRGFRIYEYVPYGQNWLPYSIRRLKERKRNILLLMRSLLSQ